MRTLFRTLTRLIVGTVLVALLLVGGTAFRVWQYARSSAETPTDVIVVMGAAQYNGVPSQWFAARLDQAAALYQAGQAPQIVTVGSNQPGDAYTEAGSGKRYLEQSGVPASAVTAVPVGNDTLESARAFGDVAREQHWKSATVVTDPWHSLRARMMIRDQGMDVQAAPTRHGPAVWTREVQVKSIIHETGGVLYYQATHRSNILSEVDVGHFIDTLSVALEG